MSCSLVQQSFPGTGNMLIWCQCYQENQNMRPTTNCIIITCSGYCVSADHSTCNSWQPPRHRQCSSDQESPKTEGILLCGQSSCSRCDQILDLRTLIISVYGENVEKKWMELWNDLRNSLVSRINMWEKSKLFWKMSNLDVKFCYFFHQKTSIVPIF